MAKQRNGKYQYSYSMSTGFVRSRRETTLAAMNFNRGKNKYLQ